MTGSISLLMTFCAGLLSFLSPCLLPVVPFYFSFIGGISGSKRDYKDGYNHHLIAGAVCFVCGFATVFIVMSVLLARMMLFFRGVVNAAAGLIIILMGLHTLFGVFKFLNYEKRFHAAERPVNLAGCYLVGMAFGAGWTPCIGPILASILLFAGADGEILKAMRYLAVYSLGLGIPFVVCAVFFQSFIAKLAKLKGILPLIPKISGVLLITLGVFMLTGRFQRLNSAAQRYSAQFCDWAVSGDVTVRLIPAILFFTAASVVLALCFVKNVKKKVALGATGGAFLLFATLQLTGLLDSAGLLAAWILYQQSL
ncbi:MAG: cytochrome c biogenesis protein CcdA [Treponema sp.]|jgi:cytochrome c-type biogenesis protein|nr:cytochrome c biogenesis protein CcdA [Treponema sp.]